MPFFQAPPSPTLASFPSHWRSMPMPTPAMVLPFLDPPGPGGHVLWSGPSGLGDFNVDHQAILRWSPDREVGHGPPWPVVRLLLVWKLGAAAVEGKVIRNTCGSPACCCLDHWALKTRKEIARRLRKLTPDTEP